MELNSKFKIFLLLKINTFEDFVQKMLMFIHFVQASMCTILILKARYSRITRSIPWMLMPWLLPSPSHQQPQYWLCRVNCPLSSTKKDLDYLNSLAPGRCNCDFENVTFNLALLIGIFKSSYDNVHRWIRQNLTDDKSTLVQVMAWCHQATSHYLKQCWPRSPTPYGVTRPQWVNHASVE